ncbi:orotidine-5'-phosphate decarboxylase [Pelagibacteraceae bacterium]|nr:orotidine-5'-phosphate decarboxylase [Pelagibacteraceae bacterium]
MNKIKNKIFIACDTADLNKARRIIKETYNSKMNIGYKFGLEFFNSKYGRSFISKINIKNDVWLDLKLFDIPNTVGSSIISLKDLKKVSYVTVHISGGLEMLKTAKKVAKKVNKKLKVLGVSVLTSFNDQSIKKIGHTKKISKIVLQQVKLAKKAGLDGVVCSGHEIKKIKNNCKNMEIITPGIRLSGDPKQDQKRVMTPNQAFKHGATSIVIGRSITQGSIKKNMQKLIKSLK